MATTLLLLKNMFTTLYFIIKPWYNITISKPFLLHFYYSKPCLLHFYNNKTMVNFPQKSLVMTVTKNAHFY